MKCRNCTNLHLIEECKNLLWCDDVLDAPDPDVDRECEYFKHATNADHIRAMSDEELAHLLHTAEEHIFSGNLWNYEQWRKWLKSPVEVDE